MNKEDIEKYIIETKTKQIDEKHYIAYYYNNCYGDEITTFTLYEGDIRSPEYREEIIHTVECAKRYSYAKRYSEEEIIEKGKMILKNISLLRGKE